MNERPRDEDAERRRRIIRTATIYTYGLFAVTVIVAFGGAALVALIVRIPTLSYVEEWLVISAIVLLPSAFGLVIQRYRESRRRAQRPPDAEE